MTDTDPRVKVAQNLTAITHLAEHLLTQAVHSANDHELPGGDAMVALGPVADPTAYAENVDAAEWRHTADPARFPAPDLSHEDDDLAPVLQTLWYWSDEWRTTRGYPLEDRRATVTSEAGFIRGCLEWAWQELNVIEWEAFAEDIRKARRHLENVLRDGERAELTRVECDRETCERRPRLILIRGDDPTGDADFWKCPACKAHYTADDLKRAQATQLRRESAAKFVPLRDAIGVLTNLGRPERTVRSWLADSEEPVEVYCDLPTRRALVWWPDIWRRHLVTPMRKRQRGSVA